MAFQHPQARRTTRTTPHISSYPSQERLSTVSDSGDLEGRGVLLFAPPSPGLDSDWTSLASPPAPATRRLNSFGSSGASTRTSSTGRGDAVESLLPSHDGNGVFIRHGIAESLRDTSASDTSERGSLVKVRRQRRSSIAATDSSQGSRDSLDRGEGGGWALTEAALSSMTRKSAAARLRKSHAPFEDEGDLSAGFTSGSEDEHEHGRESGSTSGGGGKPSIDRELGLSLSALSAGIGSHRRRGSSNRVVSASRSLSHQNRLPLAPVGSIQRSLSPFSSPSALSRPSSDGGHLSIGSNGQRYKSKRRHRQAAGRLEEGGSSTSHKRFEASKFERIEEEERLRAERMKRVLEERLQENEVSRFKDEVLMGDLATKIMELDPATLPLLGTIDDPTPTPSRAPSPPLPSTFARIARQESSHSAFDSIGEGYLHSQRLDEQDEEGYATETEQERSPSSSNQARRPPAPAEWVHSTSPPIFAPRPPPPSSATLPRSRSTIHPSPSFAIPFSSARPRSASLRSLTSLSVPHSHPRSISKFADASPSAQSRRLSHEERILLSSTPTPPTTVTSSNSTVAAVPWGGELDSSFELAMSVWKRFLKRLTRSSSTTTTTTSPSSMTSPLPRSPSVGGGGGGGSSESRWGIEGADRGSGSEVGVY